MLTAKERREKMASMDSKIQEKEYFEKALDEAMNFGHNYVEIFDPYYPSSSTTKWLESLGYKVEFRLKCCRISW